MPENIYKNNSKDHLFVGSISSPERIKIVDTSRDMSRTLIPQAHGDGNPFPGVSRDVDNVYTNTNHSFLFLRMTAWVHSFKEIN